MIDKWQEGEKAPVALFAYRRVDHLRRVLDSLRANAEASQTDLVVFSDGPRRPEQTLEIDEVRCLVREQRGFRSVRLVPRSVNLGLSKSIISGVTDMIEEYGRTIVLEDDLVVSPAFLAYMNSGLDLYRKEERVASIHGYCYPTARTLPETFFIRGADCWGWATWRRAWECFRSDGKSLLEELKRTSSCREFDFGGTYPYVRMLEDQIKGRNDSWAIRWYASTFLKGMLTLYPGRSLITNIGFDGTGEHCGVDTNASSAHSVEEIIPVRIASRESPEGRRAFMEYFRSMQRPLWKRCLNPVYTVLRRTRQWLTR